VPALTAAVAAMFCLHSAMPAARPPWHWHGGARGAGAQEAVEAYQTGSASWYGSPRDGFEYRKTACGETMDPGAWTCAHRTLPFGTIVLVENALNRKTAVLRVNDRGPYAGGRIVDLSRRGAGEIGILERGVAPVRIWVVNEVLKGHITQAARRPGLVSLPHAPRMPHPAPPIADPPGWHVPAPFPRLPKARVGVGGEARPAPPAAWRGPLLGGRRTGLTGPAGPADPADPSNPADPANPANLRVRYAPYIKREDHGA
jgi:hypothetical protein